LGAAPDVLPHSVSFLHITALTFTPAALLFIGTAALRGAGDTRTPLYVMLGVNIVNIALSWLLINGNLGAPTLGVAGSAIGAAVARGGGGLVLIALLFRGRSDLKLSLDLRPEWDMLLRVVRIGAPSGGEQLVFQGALLIFVRFVTSLGTAAYAAHNVVLNIESLSFLPGMGYAIAASTLVGQRLGAKQLDEAEASTYEALRQGGLMMTVLGAIMILLPHQLIALFVADPQVADAGAGAMRIAGLLQPFLAINFIMSGGLRGAGDTRWPLYTKLISTWGVRLPLVIILLPLGFGLTGIWIAMCTDFAVQALLAFWQFRRGRWKTLRV
jgi:putative MATE family efflux protein